MNVPALQFRLAIDKNSDAIAPKSKPFLKWAGNKHRAKQHILPHLTKGRRLVEPFAGSCAISLASDYDRYLIADANADLIDMYRFIQSDHEALIRHAEQLFRPDYNQDEAFYRLRAEFNQSDTSVRKSAIFIYMNRHGFNGLCRYNALGQFNVPFGKYRSPTCPTNEILNFTEFAKKADFVCQSFEKTFEMVEAGDVIYADPPYVPLSATSNFTAYAKEAFGPNEQQLLAECARSSASKGCATLISNHDTPVSRALYHDAEVHAFGVQRLISSKASTRGAAPELLAIFNA
jgi:DNA adenine methylase